jgi:hypothetical protein
MGDSESGIRVGGTELGMWAAAEVWPTELARSHWQPLLTCVGGLKSAFSRIKGNIWPPDRVQQKLGTHMG